MNQDNLFVVGFAGESSTGKTTTADVLIPRASVTTEQKDVVWTHLYFALPLYQMATARQDIEGYMARDRQLYEIHRVLLDAFGNNPLFGAPSYDEMVELTYRIQEYPIVEEGKPRDFLQYVGTDLCRSYDEDCWVRWMRKKVDQEHRDFIIQRRLEGADEDDDLMFGVVISDVRFPNEVEFIKSFKNNKLIRFTARPEVIKQRQLNRDGVVMNDDQNGHPTESLVAAMDKTIFDAIIDTSDIEIEEQVKQVRDLIQPIGVH